MIRNRVILLVEDNPDDVELTLRAFAKSQVANSIEVVNDGAAALDYLLPAGASTLGEQKALPEVVLLDLKLPKVDGLDVLRRLRADERTRRLPVVILTSSNEDRDLVRGYDLGANSFVRKPVDFSAFLEAAQQIGQYWLVLNQPAPTSKGPSRS